MKSPALVGGSRRGSAVGFAGQVDEPDPVTERISNRDNTAARKRRFSIGAIYALRKMELFEKLCVGTAAVSFLGLVSAMLLLVV